MEWLLHPTYSMQETRPRCPEGTVTSVSILVFRLRLGHYRRPNARDAKCVFRDESDAEIVQNEVGKHTKFATENRVGKIAEQTEMGTNEVGKLCSKRRADLKGKICGSEAENSSSSKVLAKPPKIAEIVGISKKGEKAETVEILIQEIAPQEKVMQEMSHRTSSFSGSHLPTILSFSPVLTASTLCCGITSLLPPVLQLFFGDRLKTQLLLMSPTHLPQLQ